MTQKRNWTAGQMQDLELLKKDLANVLDKLSMIPNLTGLGMRYDKTQIQVVWDRPNCLDITIEFLEWPIDF